MKNKILWMTLIFIGVFTVSLTAQIKVTGQLTDEQNEPLIGATVIEEGTSNGVVTNDQGMYEITVDPEAVLNISFIGFESQEISIDGRQTIDVQLTEGLALNEVQIVGSRNYNSSVIDSPVAVDVVDVSKLASVNGRSEINNILQFSVPSFNATPQSGSDGADHVVPASLRGLGPDQTLVLINGKRRHQSSLVNIFGTRGRGNSGTDLNAIPILAIKRLEVLRDGASAQYGSDAIAGVINIVLQDQTDGITGSINYGAYSTNVGTGYSEESGESISNINGTDRLDGKDTAFDGGTVRLDLNYGAKIGDNGGFVNFTTEYINRNRTLRPGYPWRQGYGSPALNSFNFMVNSNIPISENTDFYAFGGRNFRNTDAYAFTRGGADDSRSVQSLYPNGFTPRITSAIIDNSVSAGIRHTTDNDWVIDFNNTYGSNLFHYFIKDSNNASLQDASGVDFDAGGHSLSTNTTGVDFSRYFEDAMAGVNIAFGLESRSENFKIFAGEEASYSIYDADGNVIVNPATQVPNADNDGTAYPGGSQGFPGYSPANAVDEYRTNFGAYLDGEFNFTSEFLASAAVRYENYSDFGDTFNFKLAARVKLAEDKLVLRGSVSSGFRAPSLPQIYYNLVFNNIVAGRSLRTLLAPNNSTITRSFGIDRLTQETANNYSLGFTLNLGDFSATVDAYSISVKDRIILTDYFSAADLNIGIEDVQFFANGVDTATNGLDIVLNYKKRFTNGLLTLGLAANYNQLNINQINSGSLNPLTFFSPFSRRYLEAAAPKSKYIFNVGYSTNRFNVLLTSTRYSQVLLEDFQWVDTPPTTQAEVTALEAIATDTYEALFAFDLSVSYQLSDLLRLTVGSNNLTNQYPTPQFDGWTDQGGFNDSVQVGSDGAYYFARLGFTF